MKKNSNGTFYKSFSILAAAALSMTLVGSPVFTAYAGSSSGVEAGAVIPDNITIDTPTALSDIALPSNAYGTLSWVDGSYVPEKRVQSCEVVFKPSTTADLSGLPGWDSASGTLTGYVTVVVSSLENDTETDSSDDTKDSSNSEESYKGETSDSTEEKGETSGEDSGADSDTSEDSSEESQDGEEQTEEKTDSQVTETPDSSTDEGEADPENPQITEAPEVTANPSETPDSASSDDTKAEVTEKPEATLSPAADNSEENKEKKDSKVTSTPEITATPGITETPHEDKDNIFDRKEEEKDKRPQNAATDLTETEKDQIAVQNHTCDGITVSGIDLPWYVQFRVSGGDDYQFTNEEDAAIFKSYEFELWDTQKNTEYKIPDGEYISVTVPVKAGYTYSIEHLLDNGAMETIIPSVDGDTMTFSTHSFSPFGIAGSKSLVGPDAGTGTETTVTPAAASSATDTSADTGNTDSADSSAVADQSDSAAEATDSSSQTDNTSDENSEDESSQTTSKKQVNTGDTTQILPFVVLFVAAAVVAGVVVFLKRKKK